MSVFFKYSVSEADVLTKSESFNNSTAFEFIALAGTKGTRILIFMIVDAVVVQAAMACFCVQPLQGPRWAAT